MPKTTKLTLQGVLRGGQTIVFDQALDLPASLPDVPVTVHVELPVSLELLSTYGAWKDAPGVEDLDKELEEQRYGRLLGSPDRQGDH
jgi:hypothetical protein